MIYLIGVFWVMVKNCNVTNSMYYNIHVDLHCLLLSNKKI